MNLCSRHSHDLLDMLKRKGMDKLIRPERAMEFGKRWLDGLALRDEFDPYVVATFEIFAKCKTMNIYVLKGGCPLCTVNVALQSTKADAHWIDNISDLMLLTARTNQLVVAR